MRRQSCSWATGVQRRCATRYASDAQDGLHPEICQFLLSGCDPPWSSIAFASRLVSRTLLTKPSAAYTELQADCFSFGVCLWEICTRDIPMRGYLRDVHAPAECPADIRLLMAECMNSDPERRPSAEELVRLSRQLPAPSELCRLLCWCSTHGAAHVAISSMSVSRNTAVQSRNVATSVMLHGYCSPWCSPAAHSWCVFYVS